MRKTLLTALCLVLAAPVAQAESTPYQPAAASASHYGYSETILDATHVRVSFSGNTDTSRDAVEGYVLYRSAEITLTRGYDYFVVLDHNVESRTELVPSEPPLPPIAPHRYRELVRYQSSSVIEIRRGVPPVTAANAYDAREVQSNLVWRVARNF